MILSLFLALSGRRSEAVIERVLAMEIGFGFPYLIFAQAVVRAWPRVQLGFGYGPYSPFLSYPFQLSSFTVQMADGLDYRLDPTARLSFNHILPFIRIFPTERNYYLELNLMMLQIIINHESDVTQVLTSTLIPKTVVGSIYMYQTMPTFNIGHIFAGKAYFLNISLGMSIPFLTYVFSNILLMNPALVGGTQANQTILDGINTQLSTSANQALAPLKRAFPILPAFQMTFGIFF